MIAFVQKTALVFGDNVASVALSLLGVSAGNFVALTVACGQSGATTPLTVSTPWITAIAPAGFSTQIYRPIGAIFYKQNAASGVQSGTVSGAAGSYFTASISEFSGVATTGALDATISNGSGTAGSAGNTGTSAATAQASELVIAAICVSADTGTATLSDPPATGYTTLGLEPTFVTHTAADFGYKLVAATGAQTASWTWTQTAYYAGALATFVDAANSPAITWLGPDLLTTGWTSTAATRYSEISEATANDTSAITGPLLGTGSTLQPYKATLVTALVAGSYSFTMRAYMRAGSASTRVNFLDAANASVGASAYQALTTTNATYTVSVTLTGTATQLQIESIP